MQTDSQIECLSSSQQISAPNSCTPAEGLRRPRPCGGLAGILNELKKFFARHRAYVMPDLDHFQGPCEHADAEHAWEDFLHADEGTIWIDCSAVCRCLTN